MQEPYLTLYKKAKPYLQTRDNDIHTRISYSYAVSLWEKENGDERIVLPAIILHDVGWIKIPAHLHAKAYGPGKRDKQLNRIHEVEGAKLAGSILEELQYPKQLIQEIVTIIEGHDSRPYSLSVNDAIVKDADKLWRFSENGMNIGMAKFSLSADLYVQYIESHIDKWFLTSSGKKFAYQEIADRKREHLWKEMPHKIS